MSIHTMMDVLHLGPRHESALGGDIALLSVLFLAGIGSVLVVGLATVALAQRRSRSYLLIALALATLLGRTITGGLAVGRVVPPGTHHLIEHALDGVMAMLLLAAVYYVRTIGRSEDPEGLDHPDDLEEGNQA